MAWPVAATRKRRHPETTQQSNPNRGEDARGRKSRSTQAANKAVTVMEMECMIATANNDLAEVNAFQASSDPDTLYYHQAMKAHNRAKFTEAVQHELRQHEDNSTYTVIPRSKVPHNA